MLCYFLGPPASYTHQAALRAFPRSTLRACPSIPLVFNTIRDETAGSASAGEEATGVVPVENSTNGPVAATLDLLADNTNSSTDVQIVGEVHVPVRHCLLGKRKPDQLQQSSRPNFSNGSRPDLSFLRALNTHPQAWGQCKRFLAEYGLIPPSAKPSTTADATSGHSTTCHDSSSTSAAAATAAADPQGETAAISSALAAEAHGLSVLLEGLEDSDKNVTRFLLLRHRRAGAATTAEPRSEAPRRRKALVTFVLAPSDPSRPGALSQTLAVFSAHGLSLTSINTRPRGGSVPWEYCFIVEIDLGLCSAESAARPLGSAALEDALADLGRVAGEWQWRGTWDVDGM